MWRSFRKLTKYQLRLRLKLKIYNGATNQNPLWIFHQIRTCIEFIQISLKFIFLFIIEAVNVSNFSDSTFKCPPSDSTAMDRSAFISIFIVSVSVVSLPFALLAHGDVDKLNRHVTFVGIVCLTDVARRLRGSNTGEHDGAGIGVLSSLFD